MEAVLVLLYISTNGLAQPASLSHQHVGNRLRDQYSIYALESGRVCVAALNSHNVDYVAEAIADVLVS